MIYHTLFQKACLYMHDPRVPHLVHVKRMLWYLKCTLDHGLLIKSFSPTSLTVYFDADWACCLNTLRSTSGYCVYLGDNLVSYSKRQVIVFRSSAEVARIHIRWSFYGRSSLAKSTFDELHRWSSVPPSSIVTTFLQSTWRPIISSIDAPSL
jgi:hypothetical protein